MSPIKYLALLVAVGSALATSPSSKAPSTVFDDSRTAQVETVSSEKKSVLEDAVTKAVGAIYATDEAPALIQDSSPFKPASTVSISGVAADTVEEIANEIPMSEKALEQVEDLASEERALTTVDLPEGIEVPATLETRIIPESFEVNVDEKDSSIVAEASTIVSQTDENEVTSESRILTTSVFASDETLTSFHTYTEADFIDQAALDPSSPDAEQNITDEPGSEYDVPLELQFESPSNESVNDPTAATEISGFVAQQAGFISTAGMSTTQRNAAVAYAQKHALSYNKAYKKYKADCTNFVSQAMKAGGWKAAEGWRWQDKAWWHKSTLDSYTWAGAENFYKFTRNESKRGTRIASLGQVRVGDVIQAKRENQKNMNHTMIVTKKVGSTIYVSYHSTDRKDYPLSKFMASSDFKNATYFAHRI